MGIKNIGKEGNDGKRKSVGGQLEEMDEGSSEMERRNEKESEAKLWGMENRDRNRWKGKKE